MWNDKLKCEATLLAYDFMVKRGKLSIPYSQCTDMTGCIELFTSIDPDVAHIAVYSGGKHDITYENEAGGWRAKRPQ